MNALERSAAMMRGTIFRRIITELPSSYRLGHGLAPSTRSMASHHVKISSIMGNDWRRFYTRSGRRVPFVPPTFNELPVPSGSWEKNNKKDNERYNKHLALGVGFFLFTITVVSRVAEFNASPPPLAGPMGADSDLCPPPEAVKKCT